MLQPQADPHPECLGDLPARCEKCGAVNDPGHACGLTYEQMRGLCAEQRDELDGLRRALAQVGAMLLTAQSSRRRLVRAIRKMRG